MRAQSASDAEARPVIANLDVEPRVASDSRSAPPAGGEGAAEPAAASAAQPKPGVPQSAPAERKTRPRAPLPTPVKVQRVVRPRSVLPVAQSVAQSACGWPAVPARLPSTAGEAEGELAGFEAHPVNGVDSVAIGPAAETVVLDPAGPAADPGAETVVLDARIATSGSAATTPGPIGGAVPDGAPIPPALEPSRQIDDGLSGLTNLDPAPLGASAARPGPLVPASGVPAAEPTAIVEAELEPGASAVEVAAALRTVLADRARDTATVTATAPTTGGGAATGHAALSPAIALTGSATIPAVVTRAVGDLLLGGAAPSQDPDWGDAPSCYAAEPSLAGDLAASVAIRAICGQPLVPYLARDVTDGMAVEGRGGLTFGVTIPFALPAGLPSDERAALRQAIVDDLLVQGLMRDRAAETLSTEVRIEAADSWLLQAGVLHDVLISPMLRDTPRTWATVRTVLQIVTRHRGVARSGGPPADIHIGTGGRAALTVRQQMAVRLLVRGYQDVLYRLGSDPYGSRRRSIAPWSVPAASPGYRNLAAATRAADSKIGTLRALSFAIACRSERDRLVFGFFDGCLDPGVVQAHIKLALGLVSFGLRSAGEPVLDLERRFGRAGSDAQRDTTQPVRLADGRLAPGAPTVYELSQDTATDRVVGLLGTVFRRDADIEQQLAVAALTAWPGARAELTDDAVPRIAEHFLPRWPQAFDHGCALLPPATPRPLIEQHSDTRRAAGRFTRPPFHALAAVADDGAVTVFDGLEVTAARFATLLRGVSGRAADQMGSGLLLTFVRLPAHGSPPTRLPPPRPGDWPRLLDWTRQVATELGTCVYVTVAATTYPENVPDDVLAGYEAFGPPEAARLMQDWRAEAPACGIILRHVPQGVELTAASAMPGRSLVALPEGASDDTAEAIDRLRQALVGVGLVARGRNRLLTARPGNPAGPTPPADADDEIAPPKPLYSADPALFDAVADQVARRLAGGGPPLPYDLGGAPAPSAPFRLDLEFVLEAGRDDTGHPAALAAIRAALAAIRPAPWTLDQPSAAGVATLSSPMIGDDAEAWQGLAAAVRAVREHGAAAAPGTTGRLSIDLAVFAGRIEHYEALFALVLAHRETLHRLGTDPGAVTTRAPWRPPALHELGPVPFPAWDGSLDEAVIQARVRIWLGLVRAALRPPAGPPRPALGRPDIQLPAGRVAAHAGQRQQIRHPTDRPLISGRTAVYEPGPAAQTAAARRLIDTALIRRSDREQAAALFHITAWPGARVGRIHVALSEGCALFEDPERPISAARARAHAAALGDRVFVAGAGLDPRRGVPLVHGGMGAATAAPGWFARLLAEAGWRPGTAVALWFGAAPRRDPATLAAWARDLAGALPGPVFLDADGAQAARMPGSLIEEFALFADADGVRPGLDWTVAPPRRIWLGRAAPDGALPAPPRLIRLPGRRMHDFIRDASWHGIDTGVDADGGAESGPGAGAGVVFARPAEIGRLARRLDALDRHDRLLTALFARSRRGIPQVSVAGAERDLAPEELAAVLFRHAGAAPGAELRLVVLDPVEPDDDAWRDWARGVAVATARPVHYAGPGTSTLIAEFGQRRRSGGRARDYRLASDAGGDPTGPLWRTAAPRGTTAASAFTDDRGWLRPVAKITGEERRWPERHSSLAGRAG